MSSDRLEAAQQSMEDRGVDALLVGPSADLRYLVGYDAPELERLTLLVVPARGRPSLVVPVLEEPRARASGVEEQVDLVPWDEEEDPFAAVSKALADAGVTGEPTFAVQDRLWSSFLLRLQERLPARRWLPGGTVMRQLRVTKNADELDALRRAGAAIDAVHARVPEVLRAGRTEREVGRDISELILEEHDTAEFVIVASGPNGASPHHETADRTIEVGDAVVIDIGGMRDGYCSDMTRNYVVGDAPEGYHEVHAVLLEAQRAAVEAVRAGVRAEEVDAVARRIIEDAGYGDRFVHRTGHGIGVEVHEEPYIVAGNSELLRPGMTFSVEPGIYLPGRFGARIEDIVAVTEDGVERLNTHTRELTEVSA